MAQHSPPNAGSNRSRLSGGAITMLVGLALLVIFMAQNTEKITLHFLAWSFTWPLWLFTLVIACLGALVWIGAGMLRRHRRRKERRAERRG